jgi:hypothetical protein
MTISPEYMTFTQIHAAKLNNMIDDKFLTQRVNELTHKLFNPYGGVYNYAHEGMDASELTLENYVWASREVQAVLEERFGISPILAQIDHFHERILNTPLKVLSCIKLTEIAMIAIFNKKISHSKLWFGLMDLSELQHAKKRYNSLIALRLEIMEKQSFYQSIVDPRTNCGSQDSFGLSHLIITNSL